MSDLGGDVGQSALGLSAKLIEALLRLFDRIYQAQLDKGRRELTQEQLSALRNETERKQALENLNGKTGLVNYQELKKSGVPLQTFGVYLTRDELERLGAQCKREGILITGMTDSTKLSPLGEVKYELCCKTEDLAALRGVLGLVTDNVRIDIAEKREAELVAKGEENLTEAEKQELEQIRIEREQIQRGACREMNHQTTEAVVGGKDNPVTLDKALDHYCGGGYDKKEPFSIVADAQDPTKYIRCRAETDEFHGKEYTKTTYEVCHGDDVLLTTHDGRFEGRPDGYWQQQKEAMQEAGQFSGTFYKFYSEEEYREWAQSLEQENEADLGFMKIADTKERADVAIQELNSQLDERGAHIVNGVVCDKQTNEPIKVSPDMTHEQQMNSAELLKIGEQLANYEEMKRLYQGVVVYNATLAFADHDSAEYKEAEAEVKATLEKLAVLEEKERELDGERRELNGAQAEHEVRESVEERLYSPEDREKIAALEDKHYIACGELDELLEEQIGAEKAGQTERAAELFGKIEEKVQEVTAIEEELDETRFEAAVKYQKMAELDAQRHDERREERVAEKDERQMSMEEVKGEVAKVRAAESVQANDVADRAVMSQGAKAATSKSSKPLER